MALGGRASLRDEERRKAEGTGRVPVQAAVPMRAPTAARAAAAVLDREEGSPRSGRARGAENEMGILPRKCAKQFETSSPASAGRANKPALGDGTGNTGDAAAAANCYLAHSKIPVGGWFQPCSTCRHWTASTLQVDAMEVAICKRCQLTLVRRFAPQRSKSSEDLRFGSPESSTSPSTASVQSTPGGSDDRATTAEYEP